MSLFQMTLEYIVEALLFAADKPLSIAELLALVNSRELNADALQMQTALDTLMERYNGRGVELQKLASGYRFQTSVAASHRVSALFDERPPRYSRALLETLAIIAYRQPVTRGEIEDIRGVAVNSSIVKTLQEREWIKIIGHKEVPGRPALLGTTRQFLDYFNLQSLEQLPTIADTGESADGLVDSLTDALKQDPGVVH
ncbi:SMC-Scp complex subunit ScpB [Allohahella marinimesophila]